MSESIFVKCLIQPNSIYLNYSQYQVESALSRVEFFSSLRISLLHHDEVFCSFFSLGNVIRGFIASTHQECENHKIATTLHMHCNLLDGLFVGWTSIFIIINKNTMSSN